MHDTKAPVTHFQEEYRFLSNFWPATVVVDGLTYPSAEHAYQASKFVNPEYREVIRQAKSPGLAKRLGQDKEEPIRPNWHGHLDGVYMEQAIRSKFENNPELRELLLATGDRLLIEGNHWHDNRWGNCDCGQEECKDPGANRLGKILMDVRERLRTKEGNNE